jgi:hypothetical protein
MDQKLKHKKCSECGNWFAKQNSLQSVCSYYCANKKKNKTAAASASKKKQASVKSGLSERDVFEEIWNSFPPEKRVSFVTGKRLSDTQNARAWYFSHVLPKGKAKYPMFMYYKKNIVFKEFKEHELWEYHQNDLKDNPLWDKVFALKDELIEEYKEHLELFKQGKVEYYKI